ncbi:carbohydrate ABC transporter permease [Bacillus sp. EB106-08-02-XG196]|jgi:raffinose/stachyose/melibiose transport system permease protein|uniref:carbohydrate ABC transporter permease n=1 Tax=Bacillus sp. EB106-08-02-XG196 TaxID=2737049 RepID=UPI0015C42EE0|nr:carbohydrate ABC transporter permease [Bacillus sp. EB106-08-02-XG196]NWQ40556.1 carbohydrate ABC transporter permease [Bacillus sp. EB106-08-02-XG196]
MKNKLLLYGFVLFMALLFFEPMAFTVISSFKGNTEIFGSPFSLPEVFKFENYVIAWKEANMSGYFLNSILISLATVVIVAIVSSMASFTLSRFNLKLNRFLDLFFLMGMMVPMHTVLVPVAYIIGTFGLKNNLAALVLLYVAFSLSFSILVMTRFMKGISASLEEAAIMDGASYFQIYYKIMLPMSVPAISTISIFNFLGAWNNILFPLLFINDDRLKPISIGLLNFNGERGSEYGPLMAAIVITIIVPLIVYLLFQEKVEGGLAAGAVKE